MNRRHFLAAAAAPALGQALQSEEEGFTSLFDGQSLKGWMVREGPESAFYVRDGAIVIHEKANFPTWLSSEQQYENFDFRCEVFIKGWSNSGIYIHAPEHGRNTWCGMKINLFHKKDEKPLPESIGSIFPLVAPLKVNVRNQGEWNAVRVLMDWPVLRVWINGELVQNLNVETVPELRYRLRRGFVGFESLSYPLRFRNIRIKRLPGKEKWTSLYEVPADLDKWWVQEGKPRIEPLDYVLHMDGLGHFATKEKWRDFELHTYIRASRHSNGGILFRADGGGSKRHYEIQIHDVEGAVYPTGSLYHHKRAIYPRILPEEWYLFQLLVKDRWCLVRINGETVMEYDQIEDLEPGHILLQAHQTGKWIEYKRLKLKAL